MNRKKGIYLLALLAVVGFCGCAETAARTGGRLAVSQKSRAAAQMTSDKLDPDGQALYQEKQAAEPSVSQSFAAALSVAKTLDQFIIVETESEDSTTAIVTMHEKREGSWVEILRTEGYVGYNGIAKEQEGDGKTPSGLYGLSVPFGTRADPGSILPYTQIDDSYWWVGDYESDFFNRLCQDDDPDRDWKLDAKESEHLVEIDGYEYCLFIEYNTEGQKNKGSCIFLHCIGDNPPTLGCVAVPQEDMIRILQSVREGCRILIDTTKNLSRY